MTFIIISFSFFFVLVVYILVKHLQGVTGQKKLPSSDGPISLVNAHFATLTGALKIGDETISYYSYANQPEIIARVEALLRNGLNNRGSVPGSHGKVARVETTASAWRIVTAMILVTGVLALVLYIWKGVLLPEERKVKVVISAALAVVTLLNIVFNLIKDSMLMKWELHNDDLFIGKWKLKAIVPIRHITALNIEIAREKIRRKTRQPGFVLEVKHDERYTRFHDARLDKLLPLYDAIVARRPDLKMS